MEMVTEISNLITTVGFPIVACIFLYKQNITQANIHKDEISNLSKVIENNTNTITKLYEKIDTMIDLMRGDK